LFLDLVRWDQYNAKDVLKRITIPALVLQSTFFDADLKWAPIRAGMTAPWMDLVASLVQKSEAKIIPGAGHFAMIEAAGITRLQRSYYPVRLPPMPPPEATGGWPFSPW
jgi:pimeloyl-ACP methyl ester carboxylesterase